MSYRIIIESSEHILDSPWRDCEMVAFDTETTDIDPLTCGITQVAIVRFKFGVDGVDIKDEYNILLNPEKPIHEKASLATGITDDMVKDCPTFGDVWREIRQKLDADVCVGYNIFGFDMPLLQRMFDEISDTAVAFSAPIDCHLWFFNKKKKLKGTKQGDAAKEYGVGVMAQVAHGQAKLHDALTDVRVCANLLHKMSVRDIHAYSVRELLIEQENISQKLELYKIKNGMKK